MGRKLYFAVLTMVLVSAMAWPAVAAAQARHPGPGPGHPGGPTVVVRGYYGGYWGYPYYSPFWGFSPWYPYWGWGPGYYWGAYDPSGSVRLQVTPKEAQVFVDGYYVGIVDDFDGTFQSLHLSPGGHELTLYLEGYRTVRQSFYAATGRDFKVKYAMVPLKPGEAAEPPPKPTEPPEEQALPPSTRAAQPSPRQAQAAIDAKGFGTLSIRVQPGDAEVLIDGEKWRGPEAQERLLVQVAEGSHKVEIQKAGFVTFSTEIQVRGGETVPLNVSLPPRTP
jgi:hypothetical protein